MIAFLLLLFLGTAGAYNADDLLQLERTGQCPGCNLSGANLSDAYLSGANLSNADLSEANLRNAYLSGADLSGANLGSANLNVAYLSGADLRGANLSGANLKDAYLSGADLSGATWIDGRTCASGSYGECKFENDSNRNGSLTVTISPEQAVTDGAQWRRVDTLNWRNSGFTETNVAAGDYMIEFKEIEDWIRPEEQRVEIYAGELTGLAVNYRPITRTVDIFITVNPPEGGSADGDGSYQVGEEVTVTASPNRGFTFINWTTNDQVIATTEKHTFTAVSNTRLSANFTREVTYNLTYKAGAGGKVEGNISQTVKEGEDGSAVQAVPEPGYQFYQWDDERVDNPRIDKNITNDKTVTALFNARRFDEGEGTRNDPFRIANPDHLHWVRDFPDSFFVLTNDIDLNGFENWKPIGTAAEPFTGQFDGNGYTIRNLTIDNSDTDYTGLFGYAENAMIVNTGVEGSDVRGRNNIGGLVGYALNVTISESYVTGYINGRDNVGGMVGHLDATSESSISDSYANCNVNGEVGVGGLVGSLAYTSAIQKAYAVGRVAGNSDDGGLVGRNRHDRYENVMNSYWDIQVGPSSSSGGTGKRTTEMMRRSTFKAWDFDNVWAIREGFTYPYLQQQPAPYNDNNVDSIFDSCFISTTKRL